MGQERPRGPSRLEEQGSCLSSSDRGQDLLGPFGDMRMVSLPTGAGPGEQEVGVGRQLTYLIPGTSQDFGLEPT